MKSKPKSAPPTAAQQQAAACALAEKQRAEFEMAGRKLGTAVRFSFLRLIQKAYGVQYEQALSIFEAAVKNGEVKEVARPEGLDGVKFYEMQKEEK